MGKKKQATPEVVSREPIGSREVHSLYIHDGIITTVKSRFIGEEALEDLFYEILTRKLTNANNSVVQYKDSQPAACVPLIGGN